MSTPDLTEEVKDNSHVDANRDTPKGDQTPGRRYITKRREPNSKDDSAPTQDSEQNIENEQPEPQQQQHQAKRTSGQKQLSNNELTDRHSKQPSGQHDHKLIPMKRPSGNKQPKRPGNNDNSNNNDNKNKLPSGNLDQKNRPSTEKSRQQGGRRSKGSNPGNNNNSGSNPEVGRKSGTNRPSGTRHSKRNQQHKQLEEEFYDEDEFFENEILDQKRLSVARMAVPPPPRTRWSSSAQLGTLEPVGEKTPVESESDDLTPLNPDANDSTRTRTPQSPHRKTSAPPAPVRSLVTPIYAPERLGIPPVSYQGVPVVYVPVPVTISNSGNAKSDEKPLPTLPPTLPATLQSLQRPQCKYWKAGTCKFGDGCAFSHSDEPVVIVPTPVHHVMPPILPPPPAVIPPPAQHSDEKTNVETSSTDKKWRSNGSLSKEHTLAALRLLVHIEEIQANNANATLEISDTESITITELYYRLESRDVEPAVPIILTLNDIYNSDEFMSIPDCASRIVPRLPDATLDLGAILNTSRLVDNDALLFFAVLIRDVQEHFYHEFKSKYLLTTPDGTYNTEAVGKILEQLGVTEQEILGKFNFSEAKKSVQASKRWRSLFILNDPTLITFVDKNIDSEKGEDLKWQILRKLDEYVRSVTKTKENIPGETTHSPLSKNQNSPSGLTSSTGNAAAKELPAFEVRSFDEPRGQSSRKKLWNEFTASTTPLEVYNELTANVAELVVPGITNFPAIFNVLSEKLKIRRLPDGQRNLDGKLAAISKMLTVFPEILLMPEVLQRADGKLHFYRSVTAQHQFGSVYVEMMTRLKKKYLYKSSLPKPT